MQITLLGNECKSDYNIWFSFETADHFPPFIKKRDFSLPVDLTMLWNHLFTYSFIHWFNYPTLGKEGHMTGIGAGEENAKIKN